MKILQKANSVATVIPFFNEESTISEIINRTIKFSDVIILINDGSNDNSLQHIPVNQKIILISFPENKGKGAALKAGFLKSIELNCTVTIALDADLQHQPELIPEFVSALKKYDIVIGNRLKDKRGMPFHRILSNRLTSYLLSKKLGVKISDSQCGFRGYRNDCLSKLLPSSVGFEAESEILFLAAGYNFDIGEINIPTIYGIRKSKMRAIQTIRGFLKVLLMKQ